jgi:hypothetical protein
MGLDIRLPIGMLFATLGILLILFGLFSNPSLYAQSLGVNVNLDWGGVLLVFGIVMLLVGWRGMSGLRSKQMESTAAVSRESRH